MSRSLALLPVLSLFLGAQTPPPAAPPAAAPATAAPESPVVARVGSGVITQADVMAFLETLNPQQRMQLQMTPGGMDMITKRLAERKLLAEMGRRAGLEQDAKYVRRLASSKDELLAFAYLETQNDVLLKKGEVNEEEVKAFYESHKDKFAVAESYDARHILVGKRPQGAEKDRTDKEIDAIVKKVQAALKAGKKFEDLVEKYSDDPGSKASKGLYPGVQKGQFVPEFEKAALTQPLGKVGQPVKTSFGVHLIRVEKRTQAATQPFEAVKDQVKQQVQQEKGLKVWNEMIDTLKKDIPMEILPPPAPKPAPAPAPEPAKPEGEKK